MRSRNLVPGLLLILVGALLQLSKLDVIYVIDLWPAVIILAGIGFLFMWARNRNDYGLLMPASVLIVVGGLFQYCAYFGWWNMGVYWPFFVIAPGLGFLLMYLLGEPEAGLLVPAGFLLIIGIVFLSVNRWSGWAWPLFLVVAGLLILLRKPVESTAPGPEGGTEGEIPPAAGE